ncbi:MAG: hypothetical protein AAGJ18_16895, partial [Bacteroidota bacterium]
MSGGYLGVSLGTNFWQQPTLTSSITTDGKIERPMFRGNLQYSTINVGWQRRFGKRGFLNIELGAGVKHNTKQVIDGTLPEEPILFEFLRPLPKWQGLVHYKVGIGLAINGKSDTQIQTPILEYHKADQDMWKIDLFPILLNLGREGYAGKINVGYERGIGKSNFSVNTNFLYNATQTLNDINRNKRLLFQLSPRFYYNLKNRIRKGKTANNLSADYFSIRNEWVLVHENASIANYSITALWGVQRRIFEHMFVNYQAGYTFPSPNVRTISFGQIISELKIGLAF